MNYSVDVTYDRPLVKRALNRFMLNRLGWEVIIGLPGVVLFLSVLAMSGAWNIWLSIVSGLLAISTSTMVFIYFLRLHASEGFFQKAKNPRVTFVISVDGITTESDLGSSQLKWAMFDELLKFPDVWLLVYARSGYLTLPTTGMSTECKAFLEAQLEQAKGSA